MTGSMSPWWMLTGALVALALLLAPLPLLDRRRLAGDSVWAKPLKFAVSLALHFATLAILVDRLPTGAAGLLDAVAIAAAAATLYEMSYIIVRAARGEASHFNVATPLAAALYAGMAIGAVVITAAAGAVGLALASAGAPDLGPATLLGAVIGLVGGTVLTFVTAFPMGGALSHHVGAMPEHNRRLPLTGWSIDVADRRIPHFLGTHAMQVLPVAGLVLDQFLPATPARIAVLAVSLLYATLVLAAAHLAGRGIPLSRVWPGLVKAANRKVQPAPVKP